MESGVGPKLMVRRGRWRELYKNMLNTRRLLRRKIKRERKSRCSLRRLALRDMALVLKCALGKWFKLGDTQNFTLTDWAVERSHRRASFGDPVLDWPRRREPLFNLVDIHLETVHGSGNGVSDDSIGEDDSTAQSHATVSFDNGSSTAEELPVPHGQIRHYSLDRG